jgi:hypothetical protein
VLAAYLIPPAWKKTVVKQSQQRKDVVHTPRALTEMFAGASVALMASLLSGAAIAHATPASAACGATATITACAQPEPGSGKVDLTLSGPSGTRKLLGTCPAQKPQTVVIMPPFTATSYNNLSQCRIALVDNGGMSHPIPADSGKLPNELVVTRVVIEPIR